MTGIELIIAERKRQVEAKGWTQEYDRIHTSGELSDAAVCYAGAASAMIRGASPQELTEDQDVSWPFPADENGLYGPYISDDILRNLEKAGALIVAEIDRLMNSGYQRPAAPVKYARRKMSENDLILLPCPFCWGAASYMSDGDELACVKCQQCGATSKEVFQLNRDPRPELAALWNSRITAQDVFGAKSGNPPAQGV